MSADNSEILLLKASLEGDTAAFEKIVSRYQGYICAVTYSAVGDVEKSEELAHEAFISAWSSLDQLRDLGKFRGWLGTITRNVVRNWFRAKRKDVISEAASIDSVDESAVADETNDEQALTSERLAVVEQALKRIPESYREVIVLFYRQDKSVKEVAEFLELSEATVRQRLSRGRQMLKEQAAEMIETTISRTGPSKAFTACVMGSVGALALKGAATAGAAVAAGSSAGTASGLSALFGTVAAKVITAAAVAVIAVGGAVVYKNTISPPAEENKPVAVNTGQGNETDQNTDNATVEKSGDENIASSNPGGSFVEPVNSGVAAAADNTVTSKQTAPHYIDPNTLTDIYFKKTDFRDGSVLSVEESWIKKPNCWRALRDNKTIINNGRVRLELDHNKKTAELGESSNPKGEIPEYPDSKMLFSMIQIGRNLITGMDVRYGHTLLKEEHGYKLEPPTPGEKTSDGLMKYSVLITEGDGHGLMHVYVDPHTGLLQKMYIEVAAEEDRDQEYLFDYSTLDMSLFSLEVPEGYKQYAKRLSPKFQGWIFDKDAKPVANAVIYLMGSNHRGVKGTSNSDGEFDFYIPVGNWGDDEAMEYPIFVRAISTDHPGQVAWTVIQSPGVDYELKAVIPSPGEVLREARGEVSSDCLAVHNVSLMLEPAATVSGFVFDRVTGEPVANAEAELDARMNGKTWDVIEGIAGPGLRGDYRVKTDENGFYIFTCLPTFAWPKDSLEEALKAYRSDKRWKYVIDLSLRVECDGYLSDGTGLGSLTPKDSLKDRQVDFVLVPANVTVRGRVTDNYGVPISGYQVEYCINRNGTGMNCGGAYTRTNENGEYEIAGCAYDKTLSMRVESGTKPYKWDEEEATKGTEFVYYGYKYYPVEIKEGVHEYEIDIVLEKPETVAVFDIKDTSGQPLEGVHVGFSYNGNGIGYNWVKQLKGVSGKDGKCVIANLPNLKGQALSFGVGSRSIRNPSNEKIIEYKGYSYELKDLPDGRDGYVIEVIMPRKGEKLDRNKRVRLVEDGE